MISYFLDRQIANQIIANDIPHYVGERGWLAQILDHPPQANTVATERQDTYYLLTYTGNRKLFHSLYSRFARLVRSNVRSSFLFNKRDNVESSWIALSDITYYDHPDTYFAHYTGGKMYYHKNLSILVPPITDKVFIAELRQTGG